MALKLDTLAELSALDADDIIDVRAPSEFAEDHIPGAINLPALSDAERARVGTIYVQDSPFKARKIGAALVARNVATHLETELAEQPGGWKPVVYCWRGGQRSGSVVSILSQIGWRAQQLEGGYKSYRRLVKALLYDAPLPHKLILIDGGTGTAKTRLLEALNEAGAQVLDLEHLASHRGSLFGLVGPAQPSQKWFESQVAMALSRFDPSRPVFVEAESNKIGRLIVPPSLWQKMIRAPRFELSAPLPARAKHLARDYDDLIEDPVRLEGILEQLVSYHGRSQVDLWHGLARNGDMCALAEGLIETHYDPRYRRITRKEAPDPTRIALPDLSDSTLAETAATLIAQTDD
ncbi:tRNA 2-selenouridine synthase [Aliiroseovarius pelagivivens]|uniref:tRNA 2-selenouridine synthase n=1 Tax=Aliiroseovarius pelagivivens TaxID=1639690 RepID=A0A2R8ALB2_9RHOB|nr:tRNA 2-selenouridine(34) synthase MnmH [Aliiroseovarius pelagivivens]SPF76786.1 tRNA 2-selenouridine synthase [Aliiroseovarius pelagivivens]